MRAPGSDDPVEPFEDRIREWGRRPSRTPAAVARTRVMARLPEFRRPLPSLRLLAAATLLVVLVVAVWHGSPRPSGEATPSSMAAFVPSLDSNVVIWVVDSKTTVYFVLDRSVSRERGVS